LNCSFGSSTGGHRMDLKRSKTGQIEIAMLPINSVIPSSARIRTFRAYYCEKCRQVNVVFFQIASDRTSTINYNNISNIL
jgi:hypothetical protein